MDLIIIAVVFIALIVLILGIVNAEPETKEVLLSQQPSHQQTPSQPKPNIEINLPPIDLSYVLGFPLQAVNQVLDLINKTPMLPSTTQDSIEPVILPEPIPIEETSEPLSTGIGYQPQPFTNIPQQIMGTGGGYRPIMIPR